MKKKPLLYFLKVGNELTKILRIMRLIIILMIIGIFQVNASVYSQNEVFSFKESGLTMRGVFKTIEKTSKFKFFFNDDLTNVDKRVEVANKLKINQVLDAVLAGTDLSYKILENNLVIISPSVLLQQKKITGVITDATTGQPLIGVSVKIQGTTKGTVSDVNGKYTLDVPGPKAVLVYTYMGYLSETITVSNMTSFDIQLKADVKKLDEVVVVGYGTQKKVNLTGAVSSITGGNLTKRPVTNPITMLQGQVPGLQIIQGVGQPGNESVTIRIRGMGTYSSAGSDPLVLIDGVPGSLTNLNANDIENVSVLKDAASASIYGARAANGVILVTTKAGTDGALKIKFDQNIGIYTPTRMLSLVTNSADYMRLFNEAKQNSGIASPASTYPQSIIDLYQNATDRVKYPNFDWVDYMFNPAVVQSYNLSLSGGVRGTTYSITGGYANQPGIMKGFSFEKYNFRANLKSQIKPWATIGANISLERGDRENPRQGQEDAFLSTIAQAPTYGPVLPDGSGYVSSAYNWESYNKNMAAIVGSGTLTKSINYDISSQLWSDIRIFKGFSWYTKAAFNLTDYSYKDWRPVVQLYNYQTGAATQTLDVGGQGLVSYNERKFYSNLFSYLKYDFSLGSKHNLSIQTGYSQEYNNYQYLQGYRQIYNSNYLQELDAGTSDVQTTSGSANDWAIMSMFGRLNYSYKEKYLFESNIRYDGTSRINESNRWGWFPSFSAGWRLTEEDFIKNLKLNWLNNAKIRASYGILGNQNIGLYPYQDLLSFTGQYSFNNSNLSNGVAQTSFSNTNIKWESTAITDVGVDLQVLKGLSIVYDWYNKHTSDILRGSQVTSVLGLNSPTVNQGEMENRGNEISIQYTNQIKDGLLNGLTYNGGINFDRSRNKLVNFGSPEIGSYTINENGIPYNSFYMLKMIGVFQTQEEINNSPKQFNDNVHPGDFKYLDANKDGKIDNNDRVVVSGVFPDYSYSFNGGASWKGFDFSFVFQGVEGLKYYTTGWGIDSFRQGCITTDWLTNRWTGAGTSNNYPRIYFNGTGNSQNTRANTWYLQDASYLRLKNLIFGYTVPQNIAKKINAEKIRFYFSGDNLLTFTKYKGLDPERSGNGNFAEYPQNKIVSFGLNIEF